MSARRYVSTAWTRLLFAGARGQGQLLRDVAHVRLDGGRCNPEPLRDAAVGQALGHQREHFALAAAQGVDRVRASTAFEHLVDQGSIDHELARGHALERFDELACVEHAILEEVAAVTLLAADQAKRVARFDVLRE